MASRGKSIQIVHNLRNRKVLMPKSSVDDYDDEGFDEVDHSGRMDEGVEVNLLEQSEEDTQPFDGPAHHEFEDEEPLFDFSDDYFAAEIDIGEFVPNTVNVR